MRELMSKEVLASRILSEAGQGGGISIALALPSGRMYAGFYPLDYRGQKVNENAPMLAVSELIHALIREGHLKGA